MNVYTRRLVARSIPATRALTVLYTVPAGMTVIVRDIVVLTTEAANIQIYVQPVTAQPYQLFWEQASAGAFYHLELRQALEEGDQLISTNDGATSQMNIGITGYVFTV